MADTPQIIDVATRLGRLLAEHLAVVRYRELLKAIREDTDAQRLLADYSRQMDAISEKEHAGQPIEVQDKHRLADLQSRVAMHPQLREMQMAQMDYVDLMRKVDEAMASAGDMGGESAG